MKFKLNCESVWQRIQKEALPIIMYGTGNGADKVMDIFEGLNITLSGITASNSFVRKRTFRGFPVMPLSHFEKIYDDFVVVVSFGTSIPEVMENIYAIAQRHTVLVPVVPVTGTQIFSEDFYRKNEDKIDLAYSLLADDFSKKIYEGYVNFLYGGELDFLRSITTPEEEAFENVLRLSGNETYIDIGAYRGDTVDAFLKYSGGNYSHIICAEPDTKSYSKLLAHCEGIEKFNAFNVAVTGIDGDVGFSDVHGRQSAIGGDKITKSLSLPTLCQGVTPTYIKIDSEGCENEILEAGKKILTEHKPKLNVAAYHKCEDIFTLPILIHEANPSYKIHLRHHPYIPAWDTLFYCV